MSETYISYTANGIRTSFEHKSKIYFGLCSDDGFNRYSFKYTCSKYLTGIITYMFNSEKKEEEFYLEPSDEPKEFRSFIDAYLMSGLGSGIEEITFVNKQGDSCLLTLSDFKAEHVPVAGHSMAYIENDMFKVGAYLAWGGALSHIDYKKDNPYGCCNLLNRYDAGRLVRQSYCGISHLPYSPGTYEKNTWPYNPVQAGDQYNNRSKLVDFELSATRLYVKCRPLDWAKYNEPTPSYMETVYSLENDYIRVDNRFVDFSGFPHDFARSQKLPMFYTISALKKFSFYDGEKPWNDEPLRAERDLTYWMPSNGLFNLSEKNNETWCAWTDDSDEDFGLGLYVPKITTFFAGRFSFNGSPDSSDPATNFVAPIRRVQMVAYSPLEYSYLITAGSLNGIRKTFYNNKSLFSNESLEKY